MAEHSVWDIWFAWRPVRLGALRGGSFVWLRHIARNQCLGVTLYQDIEDSPYGARPDLLLQKLRRA